MIKGKKGGFYLAAISAIVLFIIGMLFLPVIEDITSDFRVNYQCTNTTGISDGAKVTCLLGDINVPYYIWVIMAIVGGLIINELQK